MHFSLLIIEDQVTKCNSTVWLQAGAQCTWSVPHSVVQSFETAIWVLNKLCWTIVALW